MKIYTFSVTTKVVVRTKLSVEEAVNEFQTETNYNFSSTDNVKVVDTELIDTLNC